MTGTFQDSSREFRITNMFPVRPLLNFVWNEEYIASFDQFGCTGRGSWLNEGGGSLVKVVKACDASRVLYLRDNQTGEVWSPTRNFERELFEEFYTDVGQGYSTIVGQSRGIRVTLILFVPPKGASELWSVTIENVSGRSRDISLTAYADIELNMTEHMAYNEAGKLEGSDAVYLQHHGFDLAALHTFFYFGSDRPFQSFETTNRRFKGVYGSLARPDSLSQESLSSQATNFDKECIAALQFSFSLPAGRKELLNIRLGLVKDAESARLETAQLHIRGLVAGWLRTVREESESRLQRLTVDSPDPLINSLANIWLKRQLDLGKTWGRVYNKGFRDIMQDISSFMPLAPEIAAEKILYCLNYQWESGNTLRQWEPTDLHPYRDGASWLVPSVVAYVKETGDFGFLERRATYYQSSISESVLDHCRRGINFLLTELGSHGLCLWGGGDWNDSINNCGRELRGESVWLSMATVKSTLELVGLLERLGLHAEALAYDEKAKTLKLAIEQHGWDQDHFIYGINDEGMRVGSYDTQEGRFYLNPQAYAVLAGIVDEAHGHHLLDIVEKELRCDYGYVQCKPSYTHGLPAIGRITYLHRGCYENGSVYNHGVTFKIAADCQLGRAQQAWDSISMMLANNPKNPGEKSGVEPYSMTNMFLGPENPERAGDSVMSWVTGTAGWMFRCLFEWIFGVVPDWEGLRFHPCLPPHWDGVKISRHFRGTQFDIEFKRVAGTQGVVVWEDGRLLSGNLVTPLAGTVKKVIVAVG